MTIWHTVIWLTAFPLEHIFAGGRVPGAWRGDLDGGGQVVHRGAAAQRALHDDGLRPHRRRRPRRLRQPRRVPRRSQGGKIVEGLIILYRGLKGGPLVL